VSRIFFAAARFRDARATPLCAMMARHAYAYDDARAMLISLFRWLALRYDFAMLRLLLCCAIFAYDAAITLRYRYADAATPCCCLPLYFRRRHAFAATPPDAMLRRHFRHFRCRYMRWLSHSAGSAVAAATA